jgi:NADH:ubiquinone reductase (H+-translocating)
VNLPKRLERLTDESVEVVLLSSENHLVFSPLLAEAVGREIAPLHVVVPGRQMVRRTQWITARATAIERAAREVHYVSPRGERGVLSYDHLVIACGSVVDLSIIPGLGRNAYPLKTLGDAVFLTNTLIEKLEEASMQADPRGAPAPSHGCSYWRWVQWGRGSGSN